MPVWTIRIRVKKSKKIKLILKKYIYEKKKKNTERTSDNLRSLRMGHLMYLEVTRIGLLMELVNHNTTRGALSEKTSGFRRTTEWKKTRNDRQILGPCQRTKKTEADKVDGGGWWTWNSSRWLGKETGRIENQRKNRDHPNYSIVGIGQNTEKSPGDLRKVAVIQTPVKNHKE